MPLYEYQCDSCGARFERIRKFSDPPLTTCPACGKDAVQKLVSSPAFQFKGSGWYITDYARKSGGEPGSKDAGTGSAETKTDAKSEGKSETPAAASSGASDTKTAAPPAPAAATPSKKD